ncbi:MAG: HAMP domain-containing histidine kinase [Chloroflexi bacterium]|nr:HAMP domain-containing histidine kinase [Chloroflexota bacterium]
MTIRTRLALAYAAAVGVTIVVLGAIIWVQLGEVLRTELGRRVELRIAAVESALENDQQGGLQEGDRDTAGVWVILFRPDGARSEASAGAPALTAAPWTGGATTIGGRSVLVRVNRAGAGMTVVAGADLEPVAAAQTALAGLLGLAGLAAILVSGFGGWWLAGRALGPVATMTAEAAAISQADLERRLREPRRLDELGMLARTLNRMLDRVSENVRRQKSFLAAASHDLRTPLAALQAELELADDPRVSHLELRAALRDARGDAARLADLAADLIELVAAEATGRPLVRVPTIVSDLTESVVRRLQPLARAAEVSLVADASDAQVNLDRVRAEQAIGNLVANAITHAPPGSAVEIQARATSPEEGTVLEVDVLDRGPGVRLEERELIFGPFQRGAGARGGGAGLGLATARAAAEAHGGDIGVDDRPGGGARFWMRLPA